MTSPSTRPAAASSSPAARAISLSSSTWRAARRSRRSPRRPAIISTVTAFFPPTAACSTRPRTISTASTRAVSSASMTLRAAIGASANSRPHGLDAHEIAAGTRWPHAGDRQWRHRDWIWDRPHPLNLATMEPSLVYIDTATGDVLERHVLDKALQSCRSGIWPSRRAMWWPLAASCRAGRIIRRSSVSTRRSEQPVLMAPPTQIYRGLKNYIGSVAADASGTLIAASAPKGGRITFWDAQSRASSARSA